MKKLILLLVSAVALGSVWLLPPIHQNPHYHDFANQTVHFGIPNFWNVISNIPFLLVAIAAWWKLNSSTARTLLIGIALTAFGSAYYHWQPSDARLLWDRLPMTIVFTCILTITIADRISARLGHALLCPLLIMGVTSVLYWRVTGDLRPYAAVQFYPLIAVPLVLLLFPRGATSLPMQWGMIACYTIAKLAEWLDGTKLSLAPGGAHAWKHVFAALGLFLYTQALAKAQAAEHPASPIGTLAANSSKRISPESPCLSWK